MTTAIIRSRVDQDGVFTSVEQAVLARWFGQPTPAAACNRAPRRRGMPVVDEDYEPEDDDESDHPDMYQALE
jgi:hypothetical protein